MGISVGRVGERVGLAVGDFEGSRVGGVALAVGVRVGIVAITVGALEGKEVGFGVFTLLMCATKGVEPATKYKSD